MNMFCYQCQETAGNAGCRVRGVCGKDDRTALLMDLLVHTYKGISIIIESADADEKAILKAGRLMIRGLFKTITNANFDEKKIAASVEEAVKLRDELKISTGYKGPETDYTSWQISGGIDGMVEKGKTAGVLATENEDVRSLREIVVYGIKGLSAYAEHAEVLGYEDIEIYKKIVKLLASTTKDLSVDEMTALVLETGSAAVTTMALLDKANTSTYGNPEITQVNIGVGKNPGILVSGHDLKDLEELLIQTEGKGVDIYTHSEMLPAHYYPALKKYRHLAGNYGNAWWKQDKEFATFNGPVLMTTNCIVPVKDAYKDRIYTTGQAGYPGVPHIADRAAGGRKDFSAVIAQALKCSPPEEIESGTITGGFAHAQVIALADKVVDAVKSGAIKRFIVMGGCDGRHNSRKYFTEVAEKLPEDTIILTAGCAKYRYNKLKLGDIGGIPRVLDAGQCNDSYSLAVIALKLKEVFGLDDINKLPLSFDIAWYEQKAVAVLLALLSLGVQGLRLGPTLPAFISPNVAKVLVEKFNIKQVSTADEDVAAMMAGN